MPRSSVPAPPPPLSTRARIAVVGVLAVAVGAFVLAALRTDTDPEADVTLSGETDATTGSVADGVERFIPSAGADILGQQAIGIDLEPGWLAELTLEPSNGPDIPLTADDLDVTDELALFAYQPGEDKVVERLPGGTNCVRAVIWSQVRGRDASERTERWCFSVL